ncbi:hypothetical protein [Aquimarina celericrescens]|uniref:Bacteriocin n=1 Tax=Aquimarina celericrescens TaxID=1964542 RepID=A0ABW5AV03_9FLAO
MKNLTMLSKQELNKINGGNDYYDDGNGGCIPDPNKKPKTGGPIIIIDPVLY